MDRQVNLLSIGVSGRNQSISALLSLIEQESKKGDDLIILPEMSLGFDIISMNDEAIPKMCEIAAQKRVYIAFTVFRYDDSGEARNTSLNIERVGKIAGIYDKAYPF